MATAQLLSIGSEILLGETVDTNAAHLGADLARLGPGFISTSRPAPSGLRTTTCRAKGWPTPWASR
jgi:hypothetical protein